MHILAGLVFVLAVLYFWLLGHWFARAVAFLMFAALFGVLGWFITGGDGPPRDNHGLVGLLLGGTLAWFVSGVPIYWHRYRVRHASLELALR